MEFWWGRGGGREIDRDSKRERGGGREIEMARERWGRREREGGRERKRERETLIICSAFAQQYTE